MGFGNVVFICLGKYQLTYHTVVYFVPLYLSCDQVLGELMSQS